MEADSKQGGESSPMIAVLTLQRHAEGVWITSLVEQLRKRCDKDAQIEVVVLEDLDLNRFSLSSSPPWSAVVNRVSDAADPVLAKACLAVLNASAIWNVPCFNGPRSYAIGCNKALHHHVFARANLLSPRSVVIRFGGLRTGEVQSKLQSASRMLEERGCRWPFLLKPNSAGFGVGMLLFSNMQELERYCGTLPLDNLTPSDDGVSLLQEYISPHDGMIYRVWFLDGKVQCAVKRSLIIGEGLEPTASSEFTGGCVGSSCSLPSSRSNREKKAVSRSHASTTASSQGGIGEASAHTRQDSSSEVHIAVTPEQHTFSAWNVPNDVSMDIGQILAVVGEDCHAGSVEFLINPKGGRVYFDLNMLSTLPLLGNGTVENSQHVWTEDFDPWTELADAVLRFAAFN